MGKNSFKLGFGTWGFGGRYEPDPNNDDKKDIEIIQYAIRRGLTHIDTAESYANGKTEMIVGQAIKPFKRNNLFIASKVTNSNLGYTDLIKSCENSLKRLGTNYLDLYYLHRPNNDIPHEETAKALNELLDKGLIRHVGICNATVETIKSYEKYLKVPFFAVQNHYNLIVRESIKKGVIDYCRKTNKVFIAWRPIQLPVQSLKIESLAKTGTYPLLDSIASNYNKTNAQIAIRWLTQQEGVSVLFKSTNQKHINEILETEKFQLNDQDFRILEKDFPLQKNCGFTSAGDLPLS